MSISALWGTFKALSWFQRGAGLVSFIPGVGPILGFLMGLVQLVWKAIARALRGFTSIFTNPEEVLAVSVTAMVCLALGLHWGVKWDAHLVRQAQADLASVVREMESKNAEDASLARSAASARDVAEDLERKRLAAEAEAVKRDPPSPPLTEPIAVAPNPAPAVVDPALEPAGVREPVPAAKAKVRRRQPEPGVLDGLQADFLKAYWPGNW